MKSVRIQSISGSYFPAFGLNTERYSISPYSVQMRGNAGKMRTRLTPNTDTFYAAIIGVLMVVSKILRATVLMNTSR